jgi:outer membrane protein W
MVAIVWPWRVLLCLLIAPASAVADDEVAAGRYVSDTGRFYLLVQGGHAEVVDDHVASDLSLTTADGLNFILGGGAGYNISDHWGIELQGHGTEPDVRSKVHGKVKEFSNITIVPAVRFRWRLRDLRLVPYVTAGVGGSLNEVNDTSNPRIKLEASRSSIVGAVEIGADYFVADDVAVGFGVHTFIHPDVKTEFVERDRGNRIVSRDTSSVNLTSIAGLVHLRLFFGQGGPEGERRLFLADRGPFDTDALRFYVYALGGHTSQLDDDFGAGATLKAPGDFNATLGGGVGVNLSRHWGVDIQLFNTEPNIGFTALGKLAELSTFTVLPAARFRWQLCDGRVVPFLTAGLGVTFLDVGDERRKVDQFGVGVVTAPRFDIDDSTLVGSVGVGVEYFLNRHISVGIAVPAYIYPDTDTEIRYGSSRLGPGLPLAGRGVAHGSTNLTAVAGLFLIKAYLP